MAFAHYLKRTATTGSYSYRRSIPEDCRNHWGQREYKVSLKTKKHSEALRKTAITNAGFEERVKQIRALNEREFLPSHLLLEEAKQILRDAGVHPQQIPTTKAEADAFFGKQIAWSEEYLNSIPEENSYNPDGSLQTEYVENTANPFHVAHEIIKGRLTNSLIPSISEATETYITLNNAEAKRTNHLQKKHEQRVRRAVAQLENLQRPITEINRIAARRHKEALKLANPRWATDTLNRALTTLSSVFAVAIREYELDIANPFIGLDEKARFKDSNTSETRENKRRSFTPPELSNYKSALATLNEQARIVGMIMVQTGCRTMEAAGLLLQDLDLDSDTPYIKIRFNKIRGLKTENSARDVPIFGATLDVVKSYLAKQKASSPNEPAFPRYGRDGGMDAISQLLNKIIRNNLSLSDKRLVAYSSRHTMKDKLRELEIAEDMQKAIMGHGTLGNSGSYGDGFARKKMLSILTNAENLDQWGK
jgi:integrase